MKQNNIRVIILLRAIGISMLILHIGTTSMELNQQKYRAEIWYSYTNLPLNDENGRKAGSQYPLT